MSETRAGTEYGLSTADRDTTAWFDEHYREAASQVIAFLGDDGISLAGRRVADVGCGDGIIDLGVVHQADPELLVGFDIAPTETEWLLERARASDVAGDLPPVLEFRTCEPDRLPADDDTFDLVFSWSAFEHIADPHVMCREIRRVLRPDGVLMVQLWPFYHSEHGAHLWQCLPEGFVQLQRSPEDIEAEVRRTAKYEPELVDEFLEVFATLNRITLDDLQRALLAAGLTVTKLELMSETVRVPPALARRSLSHLAISGVKLLAVPA